MTIAISIFLGVIVTLIFFVTIQVMHDIRKDDDNNLNNR